MKTKRELAKTKTQLSVANEELSAEISAIRAKEDEGKSTKEFAFSLSKEFLTPSAKGVLKNSGKKMRQAKELLLKKEFYDLIYTIKERFYDTCLNKEKYLLKKENLKNLISFTDKMKKAYKLGEISKKDLLSLNMEVKKEKKELSLSKNEIKNSLMSLKEAISSSNIEFDDISCEQNLKIKDPNLNTDDFIKESPSIKARKLKIEALRELLKKYSLFSDKYSLGVEYSDETGVKKYIASIGFPLYFSSEKRELQKREILQTLSLEISRLKNETARMKASLLRLKTRLKSIYENYETINEIGQETLRLNKMVEKSYLNGESSIVELLNAKRELIETKLKSIEYKKEYFKTLFNLYKTASVEEKEIK